MQVRSSAIVNFSGKANFGFVSKYPKCAKVPAGQTQFEFKAGDLNFHSVAYEWLVNTYGAKQTEFEYYADGE